MADQYLPIIQPEDYEAFRAIVGDEIPPTHAGWTRLLNDYNRHIAMSGNRAIGGYIRPDEFTTWMSANDKPPTMPSLREFARTKAGHDFKLPG